jgi:TPR repeat protein
MNFFFTAMGRNKAAGGKKQSPEELAGAAFAHQNSGRKAKAAELYSQAAAQGHAKSQYNLGLMYYDGEGVPQNFKKAAELYSQAAAQGIANAQYNLGMMYLNGKGVPQDVARGMALLEQAAAQGDEDAQTQLAAIASNTKAVLEASASEMAEALIREEEEAEACPMPATLILDSLHLRTGSTSIQRPEEEEGQKEGQAGCS